MRGRALVVREAPEEPYGMREHGAREAQDGIESTTAAEATAAPAEECDAVVADAAIEVDDVDAIEALGEQVVASFAEADMLTQRGLALLAEFDRLRGWDLAGYPGCAKR